MTDKLRELLEDVQTVYEGKGIVVHPNSFDRLRMEVIKLDNINKQQNEQIEKMKCCGNCNGILVGGIHAEKCRRCMDSKELSEWELKEK